MCHQRTSHSYLSLPSNCCLTHLDLYIEINGRHIKQILWIKAFASLKVFTLWNWILEEAPWKKSYDHPKQHIKKQHYFANKVRLVKAMVFPVVRYGSKSWTIKKAEYRRIDAFELWCWRRLLRVPWTTRRSNQSILKEISPEYSLEGIMLKLKLQYFGHLIRRADSLEKTLMLGKTEGRKRMGWQRMR